MKRDYTVVYRATVNVEFNIAAESPEEAYRIADETSWSMGSIEADEIHAVTVSYQDETGKHIHLNEADLNLEEETE